MLSWEWYSDVNTKTLFLHLLLTVNHKEGSLCGKRIGRGQRVCSRATLADETGLTENEIRTAIKHLISTNEITSENIRINRSNCTLFTVNKYNDYQSSDQPNNQSATSEPPVINQKQERKNDKNDKKQRKVYISSFDSFWNVYPKKKAKQDAQKAWDKLKPDDTLADTIIASVLRLSATNDWLKNNGQFIPFPATFLNGKRWEDEAQTGQAQFGNLHKLRQEMEALDEQG